MPPLKIPAGGKVLKRKPINIRGVIYKHYSSCSGMMAANMDKKELQQKGFKVLVRKHGARRIHVYKGPKKEPRKTSDKSAQIRMSKKKGKRKR